VVDRVIERLIRVDPRVLESFRKEARRRRVGYQTLINEILAQHVRKDVAYRDWSSSRVL